MATLNDPEETQAALARTDDDPASRRMTEPPPPPTRKTGPYARFTNTAEASGLLSLANARVPSDLPPRLVDERGNDRDEKRTEPPPSTQQELLASIARGRGRSTPVGLGPPPVPSITNAPTAAYPRFITPFGTGPSTPEVPREPPTPLEEMKDRMALGDYTGALTIADELLSWDPTNANVRTTAETCRGVLRNMYIARIGPLERVPQVIVPRDQLRWLSIDHRAGFVLSLIDGVSTVEMVLDVSGMPELDALRILADLAQQRIIAFQ